MRLIRYVMAFIVMMLVLGVYSQSASAFERVTKECVSRHKDIVVDKVAKVDSKIIAAAIRAERQTVTSYSQLKQNSFTLTQDAKLITANYPTGFKSRPGWRM